MIEKYITTLLNAAPALHRKHLQTTSYAQHVALGEIYAALPGAADALAEAYQGMYGILDYPDKGFDLPDEPVALLKRLMALSEQMHEELDDDSSLQNLVDEITTLIARTLYKLRLK